ncbi:MAG: hypothetical protein FWH43_05815 [Endomicrobia bacterium]|nr:hypothetical protein [Endomicrobiia bacterium]
MNKSIFAAVVLCFCFLLASCSNGNLFSWAHKSGSGDYASLMSDGDAAMKSKDFSKAAKYYKQAIGKKPNDTDAIYGYSSAVIADVLGGKVADIYAAASGNDGEDIQKIIDLLKNDQNIQNALEEIMQPDMLPSILDEPEEGLVDRNINAAIAYLLYGIMLVINDPSIRDIRDNFIVNSDYSVNIDITLDPISYALIVASLKGNLVPQIEEAIKCLDKITGNAIADNIKAVLFTLNAKIDLL